MSFCLLQISHVCFVNWYLLFLHFVHSYLNHVLMVFWLIDCVFCVCWCTGSADSRSGYFSIYVCDCRQRDVWCLHFVNVSVPWKNRKFCIWRKLLLDHSEWVLFWNHEGKSNHDCNITIALHTCFFLLLIFTPTNWLQEHSHVYSHTRVSTSGTSRADTNHHKCLAHWCPSCVFWWTTNRHSSHPSKRGERKDLLLQTTWLWGLYSMSVGLTHSSSVNLILWSLLQGVCLCQVRDVLFCRKSCDVRFSNCRLQSAIYQFW